MSSSNSKPDQNYSGHELQLLCLICWEKSPAHESAINAHITTQDGKCLIQADLFNGKGDWVKNKISHKPCFMIDNDGAHFSSPQNFTCPKIASAADVQAAHERIITAATIYGIIFATLILVRLFSFLCCKKRAFHKTPFLELALKTYKCTSSCRRPKPAPHPD